MDKFKVGDRIWQGDKIVIVRKYGGHTCIIQYLSQPLGLHTVLTNTLSKEKKMTRMELNDSKLGIGFIQVGDKTLSAMGEMTYTGNDGGFITLKSTNELKDVFPNIVWSGITVGQSFNPPKQKNILKPVQIIFNDGNTTCIFEDESKVTSRLMKGDTFDPETGVAMCIMKKLYGTRSTFQRAVSEGYFQEPKKVKPKKGK